MAIDPLKTNPFSQPLRQLAGAAKSSGQAAFAELLKSATNKLEGASPNTEQLDAMLQVARLQMLQGLFVDEDQSSEENLFAGLTLNPYAQADPGRYGQVDQLNRNLQPSLRGEMSERSSIERLIDKVAEQVSLAPELIRSVVAAESAYQPAAVSPAGAQGLMQLMPATARELGVEDSFDPHQNLLGGSRYLKQLLDKYDGDLDKALAAYNWGQGNVDRKGLEQMPGETRQYLSRVKGLLAEQV